MLNILGFLLLLLVALLCQKSGGMSNHLFDFGFITLFGALFGSLARYLRLPAAAGFVIAGIILGNSGLGIIGTTITAEASLIENIMFMILITHLTAAACVHRSVRSAVRACGAGILLPAAAGALGLGVFTLAGFPLRTGILYSLCAATVSPALGTALLSRDHLRTYRTLKELAAFGAVFIGWSLFAASDQIFQGNTVRLTLLPVATAATSAVAGIVWGLAVDSLLPDPGHRFRSAFFGLILLLGYPLVQHGGLDPLFFALGFGIHAGLFSTHPPAELDYNGFIALVIFTLFGTRISLGDAVSALVVPGDELRTAGILAGVIILGRAHWVWLARFIDHERPVDFKVFAASLAYGPMALILFHRFIPAFVLRPQSETTPIDHSAITVIITTMLLFATLIPVLFGAHALISSLKKAHPVDNS